MRLDDYIRERGISRYALSKSSGIPWATLADLYSGRTRLDRCSASTLLKLSKSLELSMEELLQLDNSPIPVEQDKAPRNPEYLEKNLPESVQKAIDDYLQGEKDGVPYLDCLSDELYGAINGNFWGGRITEEQAKYLRKKYLFVAEEESQENPAAKEDNGSGEQESDREPAIDSNTKRRKLWND